MSRDAAASGIKTLLVLPSEEESGGVLNVVENLAKFLRSRGNDVMFLFPGKTIGLKTSTYLGFPAVQLRLTVPFGQPHPIRSAVAFPLLFPIMLLQLLVLLRRHRIQIINLHYAVDCFFYFAICKRLLSLRLVTSLHGSDAFYKGRPKEKYSRPFKYVLHSSDLVILPCDAYRRKLQQVFPGIQDKLTFIHNGVDHNRFCSREAGQPAVYQAGICYALLILKSTRESTSSCTRQSRCLTAMHLSGSYSSARVQGGGNWKASQHHWGFETKLSFSARSQQPRSQGCSTAASFLFFHPERKLSALSSSKQWLRGKLGRCDGRRGNSRDH